MTMILDAGALIGLDRGDAAMWARWAEAVRASEDMTTHGGVLGQVWRGGPRQALLARALPAVGVIDLGDRLGRKAGELLGATGSADVVDAALVLLASDGDTIYTSDTDDITMLALARGIDVDIVKV